MLCIKVTAGLLLTTLLKNIYGVVISNYIVNIAAILYGYYYLRKYVNYTIADTLRTGYAETKLLIQKGLKLVPGLKKIS
jgi:hypothetical protein